MVPKDGLTSLFEFVPLLEISGIYESLAKHPRYNVFSLYVCACRSLGNTLFLYCFYMDVSFGQDSSGRTQLWKDIPIDIY